MIFCLAMSHDIRTPMNAIVGMTTLAQANLSNSLKGGGLPEKDFCIFSASAEFD